MFKLDPRTRPPVPRLTLNQLSHNHSGKEIGEERDREREKSLGKLVGNGGRVKRMQGSEDGMGRAKRCTMRENSGFIDGQR